MENWETFKKELLKDKAFAREYKRLEPQYALISQVIGRRIEKKMTQAQLAKKIGTKQSAIARMESGQANPTIEFLERVARALGTKLAIRLE